MDQKSYISNPSEEIKALALAYVQSHDLSQMRPEAVLTFYDDVLTRMWTRYEESLE